MSFAKPENESVPIKRLRMLNYKEVKLAVSRLFASEESWFANCIAAWFWIRRNHRLRSGVHVHGMNVYRSACT